MADWNCAKWGPERNSLFFKIWVTDQKYCNELILKFKSRYEK